MSYGSGTGTKFTGTGIPIFTRKNTTIFHNVEAIANVFIYSFYKYYLPDF